MPSTRRLLGFIPCTILLREFCAVDDAGKALMKTAMEQLGMSTQSFHRALKLAHTIADLTGAPEIRPTHLLVLRMRLRLALGQG